MLSETEQALGVRENPEFVPPRYNLSISKNMISRAVVKLVIILTYRAEETNFGTYFRFSSFKNVDDLMCVPFIDIVTDFIQEDHLKETEDLEKPGKKVMKC